MKTEILEGAPARAWLRDEASLRLWRALAEACPWATAFQTPEYARVWLDAYGDEVEPVVVLGTSNEALAGLLVLARQPRSGALLAIGGHQSEYQAWLCRPGDSEVFLASATGALAALPGAGRLRLLYFPDSVEAETLARSESLAPHVILREHRRPLVEIGDGSAIAASLKKKSNKSKVNRLKRRGELSLRVLDSRAELEDVIDEVAALYDLRQSAANRTAPFLEDPHKREFHLELMARGLLHAATLSVGGEIVAALLSVPDRGALAVGVFAISARLASESPGKILLLLLGRELTEAGIERIDLTPGGAWKDRFANHFDSVQELVLYFDASDAHAARRKDRANEIAKECLGRVGVTPARARAWVGAVKPSAVRRWPRQIWATRNHSIHELVLPPDPSAGDGPAVRGGVRSVAYPAHENDGQLHDVLGHCFERFEQGFECYSVRRDGRVRKILWLADVSGRDVLDVGSVHVPVRGASWLVDLTCHRRFPSLAAPDPADLEACLRLVGPADEPRTVLAFLETSDAETSRAAADQGFRPRTRITVSRRFGEEHQTLRPLSAEAVSGS